MYKVCRNPLLIPVIVTPLLVLSGCASTPKENSDITQLEQKIQNLQSLPGQPEYAPVAIEKAREELQKLRELADDGNKVDYQHQLYLTEKQIEIAEEMVATEQAEAVVSNSELRRKDILLEAQKQETQQARELAANIAMRAQELSQQVTELRTEETERGLVLTLGSVLFDSGKPTLRSGAERTVEKVAQFLNEYPERSILVEGFTDSQGSDQFNQQLSEQRAQTVKRLLVNYGVDSSRINTEGYGEEFPVANNETSAGRQQNRRVEIVIAKQNGANVSDRTSMR